MSERLSLIGALGALLVWTTITVGAGIVQAGGSASLDELTSRGIVWGIPVAGAFLLLAYARRRDEIGITMPIAWRPALVPSIAVALLLGLALVGGLPDATTLFLLALNTAFVGLSEELMFRGVLLGALLGRTGVRRAVILSAIAFGGVHSLNGLITGEIGSALAQSLIAIGMGCWAASLRLRTGSLLAPVVLHGLWDLALLSVIVAGASVELTLVVSVSAIGFAVGLGVWGWRTLGAHARATAD